ncbi:PLP-dependent aminotransferase family protein [Priestia megaterium]|uniref:MocR-like pyridoxine biosynthesis transcription factor PdxR n=1 Tax=Priestia megaterium TaxID=1404 RepID=UPI0035DAF007
MYIQLNRNSNKPLWQQLVNDIINKINIGKLIPGDKLTPSRTLAEELKISRSTIQLAYDELLCRGYVVTSRRGGTRIAPLESWSKSTNHKKKIISSPLLISNIEENYSQIGQYSCTNNHFENIEIDFTNNELLVDALFLRKWKYSLSKALNKVSIKEWCYNSPYGMLETRHQIQKYLLVGRGVKVSTEQILLVCGHQQAINLISNVLLEGKGSVALEDPGFIDERLSLLHQGIEVTGVPIDNEGMVVNLIPPRTKLIVVNPSHQGPIGTTMTLQRQQELIDLAIRNNSFILEDDYGREYRYQGIPLPSIFSKAQENVIHIVNFSNILTSGIQLSAIVGQADIIRKLARAQSFLQKQLSIMDQLTLTEFLKEGYFISHIRRLRNIYKIRQQAMIEALIDKKLHERFQIKGSNSGFSLFLEAEKNFNETKIISKGAKNGIGIRSIYPYCYNYRHKGLLLNFSLIKEYKIYEGLERLNKLLNTL